MKSKKNPLDLNNLPEDLTKDGKQILDEASSSVGVVDGHRKKKSGGRDGKDECGKIYQCRFCSLKFCKSQALGGHMNRHRQEREAETLTRARQIVFGTNNPAAAHIPIHHNHLGNGQAMTPPRCFPPPAGYMSDPALPFRPVYPSQVFPGPSSTISPPPPYHLPQPYLYPSPHAMNAGHVLTPPYGHPNYTCIGTPVGPGFRPPGGQCNGSGPLLAGSETGPGDGSMQSQEEGLSWGGTDPSPSNVGSTRQQGVDDSSLSRFEDCFF